MDIRVYPIVSSLHEDAFLKQEREKLLSELSTLLRASISLCDLDSLYEGDLALILVESGGSENEFLRVYPRLKAPYLFLTYPHNNSLAASMEILSYLKRIHQDGEILHGDIQSIARRISMLSSPIECSYDRLGVIGAPSDWLISCHVDPEEAKRVFRVELVSISTDELLGAYEAESEREEEMGDKYDPREVGKARRLHRALKRLVEKYDLKGFTIRCFDLLDSLKTTACLSLALFNDLGIVATCEGDVPALLSMYLIQKKLGKPSFQANPSQISLERSEILLAHCTLPLSLTTSYGLMSHYESGIGVAIKGEMPLGPCFLFRLSPDLDRYVLLRGEVKENLSKENLCRTQIRVHVLDDIRYFLRHPLGNHHLVVYGEADALIEYLEAQGIQRV